MAVLHITEVRNAIANVVVATLDEGVTPGNLVFLTADDVPVAILPLSQPAFAAAVGGISTSNSIFPDNDSAGGIIAKAELRDGTDTAKLTCSVTATNGGGDITLSSVNIDIHQTVSVSSMTYVAAP